MNSLAVGVVAVSSVKQGQTGDSPETQRLKINLLANKHGLEIAEWFEYWESRAYDKQPIEEAVDYCVANKIPYLLVVNFERFTRGGVRRYYHIIEPKIRNNGIVVLDYEGVADTEVIDTMEHLGGGFGYDWAEVRPSEERVMQRIHTAFVDRINTLNRLIPKEVEYERLGYWMGGDINYGYTTERIDTEHGKRALAISKESESKHIKAMYDLKEERRLSDIQIVQQINEMGYRSRIKKKRHPDKNKKTIIIGETGGVKLTVKQMYKYLENPIYAGVLIRYRKMKHGFQKQPPVWLAGTPIVTQEQWNKVNQGKWNISADADGKIYVTRGDIEGWRLFKNIYDEIYPFKKVVLCSICRNPNGMTASSSTNRFGKKYPAYHCSKDGHKLYRIPLDEFNTTLERFVKRVKLKDHVIQNLKKSYLTQFLERRSTAKTGVQTIDEKIQELLVKQDELLAKMDLYKHPKFIAKLEEEMGKLENELGLLQAGRNKQEKEKSNAQEVINTFWYYLEHQDELILQPDKPVQSAKLFSLIFTELPTYQELIDGTPKIASIYKLNAASESDCDPTGIRTLNPKLKRLLLYR